jgi:hypothetical protein
VKIRTGDEFTSNGTLASSAMINPIMDRKQVFEKIYEKKKWGSNRTFFGESLLEILNVNSIKVGVQRI